jgi:rRNA processing protein Gar1
MATNNSFTEGFHRQRDFNRALLDIYSDMYTSTLNEIDRLHDVLGGIRESITTLEISNRNLSLNQNQNLFQGSRSRNNNRRNRTSFDSTPQTNDSTPQTNRVLLNGRYYTLDYLRPEYFQPMNSDARARWYNALFTDNEQAQRDFNDPVPVIPTANELRASTIDLIFGSINNPINSSCPISLERFEDDTEVTQILHCGHIFNRDNLNTWFQSNVRCPVCRHDIRRDSRLTQTTNPADANNNQNIPQNTPANITTQTPHTTYLNDSLLNLASTTLSEMLRNNTTLDNLLDPSGNSVLLFETILRR